MRVLIADDHTMVRESLVSVLQAAGDVQVVAQAADGVEAVEKALQTRPDVVIADLSMPRLNGLEVVRRLREALPQTRVLVLTMHGEDEYVLQAVRAGASGYLVKDSAAAELLAALRSLHGGRGHFGPQAAKTLADQLQRPERPLEDPYGRLTEREREVFHLMADGMTTKDIAQRLGISTKTAENHRGHVLDKLGVRNTAELVRYALRKGLIESRPRPRDRILGRHDEVTMKRIALLLLCGLLAACGTGPVRRVSDPAANIQQLTVRADGSWAVDLRIDNFSSVPMRFDSVALDLVVGGEKAGALAGTPALTIGPEAADVASLTLAPSAAARIVLADALARGAGVTYTLDGHLTAAAQDAKARDYDIERHNALSPVPGLTGVLR